MKWPFTVNLDPDKHYLHSFVAPDSGLVHFDAQSDVPVYTYLVNDAGYRDFYEGADVRAYGGKDNRRRHRQMNIEIPAGTRFFVIIDNLSPHRALVHFGVWSP